MEQVGTKRTSILGRDGRVAGHSWEWLLKLVRRQPLLVLAGCYVFGAILPGPGLWMRNPLWSSGPSFVVLLMASLLFTLGYKIRFDSDSRLRAWVPRLDVFLLSRLFCVTCIVVLTQFGLLPDEIRTGLILVLCMPSAGSSAAWCLRVQGNNTVCAALITTTTVGWFLLSPALPSIVGYFPETISDSVSLLTSSSSQSWALWGCVPLLLGCVTNRLRTKSQVGFTGRPSSLAATIGLVAVLLLNYANAAAASGMLWNNSGDAAVAISCALLMAFALFAVTRKIAERFVPEGSQQRSAVLSTAMSNTGLAMASLLHAGAPEAAGLMLAAFTFGQHAIASRMGQAKDEVA